MGFSIAITGKGGVGKTSMAAIIVRRLIARGCRPVLAVDADPNTCLDAALGVRVAKTVGAVREEAREGAAKTMAGGISKQRLLEMRIAESLVESDDFDLIAMGRPEGPGCYCYANNVLKETLSRLSARYPYVVLDNEAGLENLSRRIVREVDLLVMVSDATQRGLETVARLHALAEEMKIAYRRLAIIVNRVRGDALPQGAAELRETTGADFLLQLQEDEPLAQCGETGASIWKLPENSGLVPAVDGLLGELGLTSGAS